MLLVLDLVGASLGLVGEGEDIIRKIAFVVNARGQLSEAFLDGHARGRLGFEWGDVESIAQQQFLTLDGKLLNVRSEGGVGLVDEVLQCIDGLGSQGGQQLVLLGLGVLGLGGIIAVGGLDLALKFLLVLSGVLLDAEFARCSFAGFDLVELLG